MIKNIFFSLLLIAGLALTACSSDDNSVEQTPKIYYMTVDATKGVNEAASPAYRRALNLSGSTLSASWATTEHVYVQGTLSSDGVTKFWFEGSIQPQTAGTTTRLNGAISLPIGWSGNVDDYVKYPYNFTLQFPRSGDLDYTGQIGTLADIAAKYDYAIATDVLFDIENDHIVGTNSATFFNQQAIVKFTLKDKADGTTLLSPTALTIDNGLGDDYPLTLTIPASTYTTNGNGVLYVAIPGFSGQNVTLTATCSSGTYNYTKSNVTFTNGNYYEISVKMTKQ